MTTCLRNVLLLGDHPLGEFTLAVDFIRKEVPGDQIRTANGIADLAALVNAGWHPDLIVVLQSWSDQFSENDVHQILSLCPLARLVCCFGPWCDSDGRTRSIWPLAVRIPAAAVGERLARELALLQTGRPSRAPLPLTASRSEIFEFDYGAPLDNQIPAPSAKQVQVISPDRPFREMLEAAMRSWSSGAQEPAAEGAPEVILFDADPWDARQMTSLRAVRGAFPQAKLVACAGFPRPHLVADLCESGADDVWFKLAPLADLRARAAR
jgi:hypothetical protein